tara:strand:+ start:75 stop:338 length:264 start_codon:yes stop_codon:yes gene_type:complete
MTQEQNIPSDNIFVKITGGFLSFIVGFFSLFIFKLIFMIPLNLFANAQNYDLMQSLGALVFIFCIYLAVKYTKYINRRTEKKQKNSS